MPTLIEAPVVVTKQPLETTNDEAVPATEPSTAAATTTSKTPNKANSLKKKSKVTPGSTTGKKKKKVTKEEGPATALAAVEPPKKQVTMLSFFGARKPAAAAAVPKAVAPATTKAVSKPAAVDFDKESLRDIVVGAVGDSSNDSPTLLLDYEQHKGSPMPTNLRVPSITRQQRFPRNPAPQRLLDRLNSDPPPPMAQPTQADDSVDVTQAAAPTQAADDEGVVPEEEETSTKAHESLALATQADVSDDDESSEENEVAVQPHEIIVAPTQGFESDDAPDDEEDEKTVCFSDADDMSLGGEDALTVEATQQPVDDTTMNGAGGEDALSVEATHQPVDELDGVDMTQPSEESDMTHVNCVDMTQADPKETDEFDDDTPMEDCVVDLTQAAASTESPEKQSDDSNMADEKENLIVIEEDEPTEKPKKRAATITAMFSSIANTTTTKAPTRQRKKPVAAATSDAAKVPAKTPKSRKKAPVKAQVTPPAAAAAAVVETTKSPERLARMKTNEALRTKAVKRLSALTERVSEGLEEEVFDLPEPSSVEVDTFGEELSQQAVIKLALVVQGSDLPLSAMARKAFDLLKGSFGDSISLESVTEKIKTYFTRENYISCSPADMRALDRFQDTATRMWRWEIMALDLLPDDVAAKVRKAQTARKKIRSHSRALISLLRALDDADKVLLVASSKQEQCDKLVTKVNNAEETVLKFERAAEKVRLMEEAKLKKEEIKQEKLKELHKEKDQKKEEAAKKKEELAKKKEDEKQKKMLKEAEKKNKEVSAKVSAIKKNKARLMTFFVAKESDASPKKASPVKAVLKPSTEAADYWKLLNSVEKDTKEPLFQNLSRSAKSSVRRRTKRVPVTVDVSTVDSSDPFSNQHQYAEQKTIYFPNKYKFLSFVEDYRPAYHGTWSKRSKLITGRTPFRQDKEFLNYDEDSEAEWEEGDDEMGEDLQDEAADGEEENVDEEGDTRIYNFEDGWMAEDDDVVYENEEADDETKMQRKKLKSDDVMLSEELVAPFVGGLPLVDAMKGNENIDVGDFIHVSEEKQEHAMASLQSVILTTEAEILSTDDVCLDAFPPCLVDDNFVGDPSSIGAAAQAKAPINQEMTPEDIKVFAEFVHHSTYASKDRLVEQLRTSKPNVASSRAQAQRKLDSIAVKRKNPVGGVIWEVKKGVLEKLGLEKQLAMKMPEPPKKVEPPAKAAKKPPKPKKDAMAKKDAKPPAKAKKVAKKVANAGKSVKKDEPNKVAKTVKKESDSKKRKEPPVSAASAALFANFLAGSKKPKTA